MKKKIRIVLIAIAVYLTLLFLLLLSEQRAAGSPIRTFWDAVWYSLVTLTTVGYGDIYPITPIGRVLGAIIAILGIGMVAVPTGILSAGFVEVLEKKNQKDPEEAESQSETSKKYCPYCGKKLD